MTNAPDPALLAKAETLVEALPYLQRYAGATFVVKYGGHAMGDPELQRDFAEDVVLLKAVGINPIVVHGGGPQIGAMLKRLGVESNFVGGLRVTDSETAKIAEMVLAGSINKEIVSWIGAAGGRAVGISGKDAGLVTAEKVTGREADPLQGIERHVDLGFVGEPTGVNPAILHSLAAQGFLLTDVAGVLDKSGELMTDLDPARIAALKADGTIKGGMIPKVETCVHAVEQGVDAAVILDGRVPHAMLLEIFTRRGAGTLVHA